MLRIHHKAIFLLSSSFFIIFFSGCVSPGKRSDTLALVDNDPVTIEDLKYSLEIEHRRQDLSSARTLDIPLYIQKLIDNRLIIHEAYRSNLDKDPDIQEKVQSFFIRESVAKLYNEEVLQKVRITEDEIRDYYSTHYEQFSLNIIEADTEKEARELHGQLRDGRAFKELALLHPSVFPKNKNGEIILTRKEMVKEVETTIDGLNPGEFSGVISVRGKYYIVLLAERQKAADSQFDKVRNTITRTIRKEKIDELSADYLQRLREQAPVRIDHQILSSMNLEDIKERKKLLRDERVLVEVYDSKLTVGEVTATLPKNITRPEEKHLKGWIDLQVVDHTALNRHYDREPAFQKKITRYTNQLLRQAFFNKIVYPQIEITDEELRNYYQENRQQFLKQARYKIQQITVKTSEDAENALENLRGGAQFSWLARQRSVDKYADGGGVRGWFFESQLDEKVKEIIGTLQPGELSPVVKTGDGFVIIRLQEKTEETVEDFVKIKDTVIRAYTSQEVRKLLGQYLARLKEDAEIIIFDDAVQAFESGFSVNVSE
jgi:parvulin-like peptidyl-prolyl isomerase